MQWLNINASKTFNWMHWSAYCRQWFKQKSSVNHRNLYSVHSTKRGVDIHAIHAMVGYSTNGILSIHLLRWPEYTEGKCCSNTKCCKIKVAFIPKYGRFLWNDFGVQNESKMLQQMKYMRQIFFLCVIEFQRQCQLRHCRDRNDQNCYVNICT